MPEPSSGADWHQKGRRSPSFLPAQESHCYPCFHMLITALPCAGMGVGVGSKPSRIPAHPFPRRAALPSASGAHQQLSPLRSEPQFPGRRREGARKDGAIPQDNPRASRGSRRMLPAPTRPKPSEAFPVGPGLPGPRVQPCTCAFIPKGWVGILAPASTTGRELCREGDGGARSKQRCQLLGQTSGIPGCSAAKPAPSRV